MINVPIASASSNLAISIGGINLNLGQHILNINIKSAPSGNSPFDSIRRIDGKQEFWLARELMPMLGYTKWESFGAKEHGMVNKSGNRVTSTVCRALISCNISGLDSSLHFAHFPSMRTSTQHGLQATPEDWKLSRHACYLIGMCGDVNKPEIAAAQSYFAVKIREAELKNKQPVDLSASSECGMLIGSAIESCIDAKLAKELELIFSYFRGMQATIDRQQAETQQLKETVKVLENMSRRQSGEDIRMRIAEVLDDPERQHLSNIKIAKICRCSEAMVRKFKKELNGDFSDDDDNSLEIELKVKIPNPWKK